MDLSLIRKQVNENLGKDAVNSAQDVIYVDWNNPKHYVLMPAWFKDLTTVPGLPFGYIVEFVGLPNAGKTTAGIIALIEAQKQGYVTILIDVEKKFSYARFVAMGGNRAKLEVISEPTIEENFHVLEQYQKAINQEYPEAKILVLYDSISVGSTRADMAKTTLDAQVMADQAKVLKRMLRRQVVLCAETGTCFIAINQMYGNPNPASHGAPSLAGGKGLEYAKALSITFKKFGKLPPKTVAGVKYDRGIITKILATKNHLQIGELSASELILHVTADAMTVAALSKGKKGKGKQSATVAGEAEEVELEEVEDEDKETFDAGE